MMQMRRWIACAGTMLATALCGPVHAGQALPNEVTINGVEFVLIPEGFFFKGSGIPAPGHPFDFQDDSTGGNVRLWLDSYYVAKYEARARDLVTYLNSDQGKTETYAGADRSCSVRMGPEGKFIRVRAEEDLPATHLSWKLADRWARWMGFRLLTEAEWEKAARGTDTRLYPWGDTYPDETYAGFKTSSACHTWPVDSFAKGKSPYGVYNMAGNVREYVSDWYNMDFDQGLKDGMRNPKGAETGSTRKDASAEFTGPWKMLKGGRWGAEEDGIRVISRVFYSDDNGFRCNSTRFGLDVETVRAHLAKGTAVVTRQ